MLVLGNLSITPKMLFLLVFVVIVFGLTIFLIILCIEEKRERDNIEEVFIPVPKYRPPEKQVLKSQPDKKPAGVDKRTVVLFGGNGDNSVQNQEHSTGKAQRGRTIKLTDISDLTRHFEHVLIPNEAVVIGRCDSVNMIIDYDFTISGIHCKIEYKNEKYYVTDLNSSNGTILDGILLTGESEIKSGQILKLGNVEFRTEFNED